MSADVVRQELAVEHGRAGVGQWVTPPVSYINPVRRFCALCGRPIARRYWQVGDGVDATTYCDPSHAALRATYPSSMGPQE